MFNKSTVFDKSGILVSAACILHCGLLALSMTVLPSLGVAALLHSPYTHIVLFLVMIILGVLSFSVRFRVHKSFKPALWMFAGITFVAIGNFAWSSMGHHHHHDMAMASSSTVNLMEYSQTVLTIFGGLLLIYGHFLNQKRACCLK